MASAQDTADLRRLARDAGIIFSGTVQKIEPVASAAPGDIGLVRITFLVEDALRGATAGEPLTVSEWDGLWTSGDRYRVGEDLLLFLYPPSGDLGLTTTVAGTRGRISLADSQLSMAAVARQIAGEPSLGRAAGAFPAQPNPIFPAACARARCGMTMRNRVLTLAVLLALALPIAVHAGGPLYVAGSGFNSGAAGTPLTWAGGQISYYTDQGDLSTLLRQADANSFVAAAFSLLDFGAHRGARGHPRRSTG